MFKNTLYSNFRRYMKPKNIDYPRREIANSRERMAKSKYEYVRNFELSDPCLPNCWIVVRVDGRGFSRFADIHGYIKPNDVRGLNLMTRSATCVMEEFRDVICAFGQSDEYSFIFRKDTNLHNRRASKLVTLVNSLFSSSFVYHWTSFFGPVRLQYPPVFDARVILYPTDKNIRDYISWRQADVHVNNLYNTTFWGLVLKKGLSHTQAEERLRGTLASDKNELLFSEFGLNYNNEPPMFRKGTILVRKLCKTPGDGKLRQVVLPFYTDVIGDAFWRENSEILGLKSLQIYHPPNEENASNANQNNQANQEQAKPPSRPESAASASSGSEQTPQQQQQSPKTPEKNDNRHGVSESKQ
ncbi:putative tRNA(His) guanylyltransferase [Blattella germanica]|nr:putative tRNA(His) guanylyltransferase [Blattella germanica]